MWQCRECAGGTSYTTKVQRKERVSAAWPKPDDSGRNLVNMKWMEARFHRVLSQSARGPPGQGHASVILFSPYSACSVLRKYWMKQFTLCTVREPDLNKDL